MMRYRSNNVFVVPDGDPRRRSAATCAAARRTTASRARASSRTAPASASSSRRTRRTRPACCARRSAATIRCCSSSTSTSTARPTTRASIPGRDYMIPFGKAAVRREGTDVVVLTWGALVQRSLLAAQQAEKDGISVMVIDLRTIMPFDWDAIAAAVKQTNRVIVAHEDQLTCGFGAELAARIGERAVRVPRRAGAPRRRARYAGRLLPGPRGSDPAAVGRRAESHPGHRQVLGIAGLRALGFGGVGRPSPLHGRSAARVLPAHRGSAIARGGAAGAHRRHVSRARRLPADRRAASTSSSIAAPTPSTPSRATRRRRSSTSAPSPAACSIRLRSTSTRRTAASSSPTRRAGSRGSRCSPRTAAASAASPCRSARNRALDARDARC